MDTNNYYFLLELSIDPPEQDPTVIEDALQKKQAVWSRLRNHPTKGPQAQQYIGMLPEIRRVMTDDTLRQQEAEAAKQLSIQNEIETHARIDRHVTLLLSKGRITKAEVSKLARLNGVSEEKIEARVAKKQPLFRVNYQIEELIRKGMSDPKYHRGLARKFSLEPGKVADWIRKKEQEKNRKIDAYLRRCNRRGYITQQEIKSLSRLYRISEDNIVRRTRCVIQKSGSPMQDLPEALDKSTEKIIEDHLKIVGNASLYDFLGVPRGAELSLLKDATQKKDLEVRKLSQKDAKATASGTLVGHCISIFKTEEKRAAYDRSLTLSRLQELNADMDVSGISGKVHSEYVAILMKNALKLGMDIDEARQHLDKYFRKRRWKVQKPKPFIAKRRPLFLRPAAIAILAVLVLATTLSVAAIQQKLVSHELAETLALADQAQPLERKAAILRTFLDRYPESDFVTDVEKRIVDLQQRVEKRDYDAACLQFEQYYRNGAYSDARAVLQGHQRKYPHGPHRKAIKDQLSVVSRAVEDRDYATLEADLDACEERQTWRKCITLCNRFYKQYPESRHAENISGLKKKYAEIIQSKADLVALQKRAAQEGIDFESARRVYLEYLESNPELPLVVKKTIVDEIAVYDRKITRFHQAEKEWTHLISAADGGRADLSKRIRQVKDFMGKYPPEWYGEEAAFLLSRLEKQKTMKTRRLRTEAENRAWKALATDAQDRRLSLASRISRVEAYLQKYPDGNYTTKAKILLVTLNKHKRIADAKQAQKRRNKLRRQEEEHRISSMLKRLGSPFIDHDNGTVTDERTGLMWCIFDAYLVENHCVDHRDAHRYVRRLGTGGYRDWRMPSVEELQMLLQNRPQFPASRSTFFWTSELFWHGWNEMAYIFSPSVNAEWTKESAGVEKCGSVLAVRN
jgi:outer membrane protein assembly factor BamD (BamD/ComL family)